MKLFALLLLAVSVACSESDEREKRQSQQIYYGQQPRGVQASSQLARFPSTAQTFRPSAAIDDESVNRNAVTPASPHQRQQTSRRPVADSQREYQHQVPVYRPQPQQQQLVRGPPVQRGQYPPKQQLQLTEEELEEEAELEKPDRLSELLPQSKFDCSAKKTGYYADDGLGCEVFHYCQDNAKHSWICPEGFQFHQVHLICMPPSGDNICAQSSEYHFVNDYLYRPINTEEHNQKPNVSLRYSDRYYPENYNHYEGVQETQQQPERQVVQQVAPVHHRRPVQQPIVRQQYAQPTQRPQQFTSAAPQRPQQFTSAAPQRPQFAPQQFVRQQPNQVFHSPEEVNIPLQHRRPVSPSPPPRNNYQERDDDEEEDEEYEYEDPPFRQG